VGEDRSFNPERPAKNKNFPKKAGSSHRLGDTLKDLRAGNAKEKG